MQTMNIPGFSADAVLFNARASYRDQTKRSMQQDCRIQPALRINPDLPTPPEYCNLFCYIDYVSAKSQCDVFDDWAYKACISRAETDYTYCGMGCPG